MFLPYQKYQPRPIGRGGLLRLGIALVGRLRGIVITQLPGNLAQQSPELRGIGGHLTFLGLHQDKGLGHVIPTNQNHYRAQHHVHRKRGHGGPLCKQGTGPLVLTGVLRQPRCVFQQQGNSFLLELRFKETRALGRLHDAFVKVKNIFPLRVSE